MTGESKTLVGYCFLGTSTALFVSLDRGFLGQRKELLIKDAELPGSQCEVRQG